MDFVFLEFIFSGGQDKRKRALNSVDVYDIRMKNWKSLSSMFEQRVYGVAEVIEGNIYVAGGSFDRTVSAFPFSGTSLHSKFEA